MKNKSTHPKMDVALVPQLSGMSDYGLECLAKVYARWARQIRALIRDKKEHADWVASRNLSAGERRYCKLEGIPAGEYLKSKGGAAR